MVTRDIRSGRVEEEYQAARRTQDRILNKVDTFEPAVLGLSEAIERNQQEIAENRRMILENRDMLPAIIKRLDVPYARRGMGFTPD